MKDELQNSQNSFFAFPFAFTNIPHFIMYQKFENCDLSYKSDQLWGAVTLFQLGRDNFYNRDSISHDITFKLSVRKHLYQFEL